MNAVIEPSDPSGRSQTVKAQVRLRELIVSGALEPGQRVAEMALVERIGVSRTPIRAALMRLQSEGLVEALPGGGYVVQGFSEADIRDAIELRGTLEGLAARFAAERGPERGVLAAAHDCVARIDALLADRAGLDDEGFACFAEQNARFHDLVIEMAGSAVLQRELERAKAMPFASPNGFVFTQPDPVHARDAVVVAQAQHRAIVDAIARGEGARAEALTREHAHMAKDHLTAVARRAAAPADLRPGVALHRPA